MASDKDNGDGGSSILTTLYRAIKHTYGLASWSSIPWLLGMLQHSNFKIKQSQSSVSLYVYVYMLTVLG